MSQLEFSVERSYYVDFCVCDATLMEVFGFDDHLVSHRDRLLQGSFMTCKLLRYPFILLFSSVTTFKQIQTTNLHYTVIRKEKIKWSGRREEQYFRPN